MHILSVITSFTTGGAEMLVSNLSREFAAQGHRASVLALSDAGAVGNSEEAEAEMRKALDAAGVCTASLSLANRRNIVAGVRALRRQLAADRPDVIHLHTAQAALFLALFRPGAPVVMTHHNSRLSFPPWLFFLFDTVVDHYVAISEKCAQTARKFSRRPITKIINAASRDFKTRESRTAIAPKPRILSVGALTAQKNYELLIHAAGRMRARNKAAASDITISIVGNGTLMERLRGLVRDQDLEGMVELLGQRNDVARLMRDADLYVNSSHYEGMPVAVIEALMSGLPVVATDVEGNREIIETGKNGLLVPASDPEVLAEAMLKVLGDSGLHAELSRGALDASKSFSLEATARLHLAIYSRLAEANEIGGVSPRMA